MIKSEKFDFKLWLLIFEIFETVLLLFGLVVVVVVIGIWREVVCVVIIFKRIGMKRWGGRNAIDKMVFMRAIERRGKVRKMNEYVEKEKVGGVCDC